MAKKRRLMKAAALFAMPTAALIVAPTLAHAQDASAAAAPVAEPAAAPQAPQAPQLTNGAELKMLTPRAGETVKSANFALDISFQSRNDSPVIAAELWVDGVRWVRRDLDTPQLKNVLSFDVDGTTLTPGTHQFLVKVFNQDGAASETSSQITVENLVQPDKAPLASGPDMKFVAGLNGKKVQGVVELTVDARSRNGQTPYVTIYVDKQFKTLKNYAPYTYLWDTTTVSNGWHVVEAMGYLESTNATTTSRIKVFVDNPGGATVKMSEVPDLNKKAAPAPVTNATAAVKPLTIPKPAAKKPAAKAPAKPAAVKSVAPKKEDATSRTAAPAHTAVPARVVTPATIKPDVTAPVASDVVLSATTKPAQPIVNATVEGAILPVAPGTLTAEATPKPLANATIATPRPKITAPVSAKNGVSAKPAFAPVPPPVHMTAASPTAKGALVPLAKNPKTTSKAFARAVVRPDAPSVMAAMAAPLAGDPIQVAFNGNAIAFDVSPRVEGGLPLAPFRQIFEYTGGQVMWIPETHVVRAVNADREVVITVGKDKARINGTTVSLDRAAFIERGRTIVPMSFVGQALDVNVEYDPATGRVSITSKK